MTVGPITLSPTATFPLHPDECSHHDTTAGILQSYLKLHPQQNSWPFPYSWCSPVLPIAPWCSSVLPGVLYGSLVLLNAPWCSSVLPDAPWCSLVLPSAPWLSKWSLLLSIPEAEPSEQVGGCDGLDKMGVVGVGRSGQVLDVF